MRSEFSILIVVAFSGLALTGAYFVTQAGVLSKSHHEWRIDVAPRGPEPWSVEVPRLMIGPNATVEDEASLTSLLQGLRSEDGIAQFQLQYSTLRIAGSGNATIVASRTAARGDESFVDWRDTGRAVSRLDDVEGPNLRVTWAVSFSGGGGHACRAEASLAVDVPPQQERALPEPVGRGVEQDEEERGDRPPEPLWKNECS